MLAFTVVWGLLAGIAPRSRRAPRREPGARCSPRAPTPSRSSGSASCFRAPLSCSRSRARWCCSPTASSTTSSTASRSARAPRRRSLAAEAITNSADFLHLGFHPAGDHGLWIARLLTLGIALPVLAAGVAGSACGSFWLRFRAPARDRDALGPARLAVPRRAAGRRRSGRRVRQRALCGPVVDARDHAAARGCRARLAALDDPHRASGGGRREADRPAHHVPELSPRDAGPHLLRLVRHLDARAAEARRLACRAAGPARTTRRRREDRRPRDLRRCGDRAHRARDRAHAPAGILARVPAGCPLRGAAEHARPGAAPRRRHLPVGHRVDERPRGRRPLPEPLGRGRVRHAPPDRPGRVSGTTSTWRSASSSSRGR